MFTLWVKGDLRPVQKVDLTLPTTVPTRSNECLGETTLGRDMDSAGIGDDDWSELQRNLEASIPVYDRVNRFGTLGFDQRWRRGVRALIPPTSKVLEVGCGPGTFAEAIEGCEVTCLDPIPAMLDAARARVNGARTARGEEEATFIEATAEDMPFEQDAFDVVCCLFSFRDFHDKPKGLAEILRVLKPGGQLIILDAAKLNFVHGWFGWLWMKLWMGTYARVVCGKRDHPWRWLAKTYAGFGTSRQYRNMLAETGFTEVRSRLLFPGMATRWTASKHN